MTITEIVISSTKIFSLEQLRQLQLSSIGTPLTTHKGDRKVIGMVKSSHLKKYPRVGFQKHGFTELVVTVGVIDEMLETVQTSRYSVGYKDECPLRLVEIGMV